MKKEGVVMYDYDGDMSYFQDQLTAKGITKDMLDITDYAGLTFRQLQGIVNNPEPFIKDYR